MIKYIKVKIMETELKYQLYTTILSLLKENKEIIELVTKLYKELKGVPMEELRHEFISALAKVIHESNTETEE